MLIVHNIGISAYILNDQLATDLYPSARYDAQLAMPILEQMLPNIKLILNGLACWNFRRVDVAYIPNS